MNSILNDCFLFHHTIKSYQWESPKQMFNICNGMIAMIQICLMIPRLFFNHYTTYVFMTAMIQLFYRKNSKTLKKGRGGPKP